MRLAVLLPCLLACDQSLEDRLAELDERATVDCGDVGDCSSQAHVDEVLTCLRDSLTTGAPARSTWILGLEEVAYVYAIDGTFLTFEGYYFDGPNFTEYECQDVRALVGSPMTCWMADATGCTAIRDWYD